MDPVEPKPTSSPATSQVLLSALLFGVGYGASALLGNAISLRPGPFVTVWLPSGLFVAVLLVHERRHWPAFILAAFLANLGFDLHNGQSFQVSALFFSGNCLEALAGAWLVQRFVAARPTLHSLREVLGFLACSAIVSPILSASVGAAVVSQHFQAGSYWAVWPVWYSGDVLGITILSPCLLAWQDRLQRPARCQWTRESSKEALHLFLICLSAIFVFMDAWHPEITLEYLLIPMVIFAAFHYSVKGATLAGLAVAVIAAWMTAHGQSHIGRSALSPREQALSLQVLLAVTGFCGLVFAVLVYERRQAEKSLRESGQRMQLATDSALLAIWDWDLQAGTMVWDDRMFELYGTTRAEVRGTVQDWKDGLHPEDLDQAIAECEAAIRGEAPFDTEFRVRHPDGTVGWVKANATVLRDFAGKPVRMVGVNRDVTAIHRTAEERLGLQAQLLQSQKMESLGTLAGGVAHDMNNVLGAILSLASAHLASLPRDTPLFSSLETIRAAAARGGDMVKRLLVFARQSPSERQALNVNALLREEVRLLERTTLAKVHLEMDLAPDLHAVLGDGSALAHALMNLCVNALDAMGDGGTLSFRTRNLGLQQIEVTMEDNGCGMTRAVLDRAMDPFFTTKEVGKGTGLGLSLVFSTVKAHGGRLNLQSEPGRGTRVTMTLPATAAQAAGPGQDLPAGPEVPAQPLQVLLVDDDDLIQKSTRMLVEVLGHRVTAATSGEAALALLAEGYRPDAVILDMNMPGLDGKATLPRLRDHCPTVPVLLATGRADQEVLDLVESQPGVGLLPKPFSFAELQGCLRQINPRG